jgi:pantoate kinase
MKEAEAFCPGHITGFFEICRAKDLLSTGSRGAGLCISKGATSRVSIGRSSKPLIDVSINGKRAEAEVTKEAIARMIGKKALHVSVATELDLPVSQGFGMSAAGALSASLATCSMLRRPRQEAFEAAHIAEIVRGGGLGDVSALHAGGITVRQKPGLPPIGKVIRIDGQPDLVLCVVGRKMLTKSVLSDPARQRAINSYGSRRVDELLEKPSLERFMELSFEFAIESGLASGRTLEAMAAASKLGMASMSMLGNSVFAVGDPKGLESVLSKYGKTYRCTVDLSGPRIIEE